MNVTAIRKNGANGDPLRSALREAIARMEQAQAVADDKDNVAARARQFLREIDGRIEEAVTGVSAARETHAAAVVDAIARGEKPPAATGLKAARAAETDLQDQRDAAQSSIDTIRQDKAAAMAELERAERAVQAAIAAVLEPEARKLLEQARFHRIEYLKKIYAIDAIRVHVPDDIIKQVEVLGCYNAPGNLDISVSVQKSWRAALDAIKTNSEAPLPGVSA
jgi:pyruvate-formate lyase